MGTVSDRKLAVVTGASSGIGLHLAKECSSNGFDVLVIAEDQAIHNVASQLVADGAKILPLVADLRTADGAKAVAAKVAELGRPIDALLLNAGVGVGGAFLETDLDAELDMIQLNCMHTVRLAKALVPAMVARKQGRVLMTASIVSTAPAPYQAVYGATKAFVMSFAEALREEIKDSGVTVTALQPGATETNFFKRAGNADNTPVGQAKKDDPALVAKRGFDAMMAGKDSVLGGGLKSRLEGLANEILPETVKAAQSAKQSKPFDKSNDKH